MYNSSYRIDSFYNFKHYQVWCFQFRILCECRKTHFKEFRSFRFGFLFFFSIYFFIFFLLLLYSIYVILNLNSKIYLIKFVFVLFFSCFCLFFFNHLIICCLVNICLKLSSFIVFCGLSFFVFTFLLYCILYV